MWWNNLYSSMLILFDSSSKLLAINADNFSLPPLHRRTRLIPIKRIFTSMQCNLHRYWARRAPIIFFSCNDIYSVSPSVNLCGVDNGILWWAMIQPATAADYIYCRKWGIMMRPVPIVSWFYLADVDAGRERAQPATMRIQQLRDCVWNCICMG